MLLYGSSAVAIFATGRWRYRGLTAPLRGHRTTIGGIAGVVALSSLPRTLRPAMLPFHQPPLGAPFLLHRLTLRIIVVLVALLRIAILPPALLPRVNVELERSAWGVFRTECYPTYDFVPVRETIRERVRTGGQ